MSLSNNRCEAGGVRGETGGQSCRYDKNHVILSDYIISIMTEALILGGHFVLAFYWMAGQTLELSWTCQ